MNYTLAEQIKLKQYQSSESLEDFLGDPFYATALISFKKGMELDKAESYPEVFIEALKGFNYHLYYLPVQWGGKLNSYEELFSLYRIISRRDASLAISDGYTFLGYLPVWIGGSEKQKFYASELVKTGKSSCLGNNEKTKFGAVNSNEIKVKKEKGGFILDGEKRPINKATETDTLCILGWSKSDEGDDLPSFYFIDKAKLSKDSYSYFPKIATVGIKGCDISGINFHQTRIDRDAIVGLEGNGMEIANRAFQIKRILCSGLFIGTADTALRTTFRFAENIDLFSIKTHWNVKQILVDSFIDIIICDCVGISAVRALQVVPDDMHIASLMTRYIIQTFTERMVSRISELFAANSFNVCGEDYQLFQKIVRDFSIINLFEGGANSTLQILLVHFKKVLNGIALPGKKIDIESIFSLNSQMPSLEFSELSQDNMNYYNLLEILKSTNDSISVMEQNNEELSMVPEVKFYLEIISNMVVKDNLTLSKINLNSIHQHQTEYHSLVIQQGTLFAALSCINFWIFNKDILFQDFKNGNWLLLCLDSLLSKFIEKDLNNKLEYSDNLFKYLTKLYGENRLFSIIPIKLASQGK